MVNGDTPARVRGTSDLISLSLVLLITKNLLVGDGFPLQMSGGSRMLQLIRNLFIDVFDCLLLFVL